MNLGSKACEFIRRILKDQEDCAVDAYGLSGGTLAVCNPRVCKLNAYKTCARILLEGKVQRFEKKHEYFEYLFPLS